jgi:hypothetical protein
MPPVSQKKRLEKKIRQNVAGILGNNGWRKNSPGVVLDLFPNRCEQPDIHRRGGRARMTLLPCCRTPRWMMPSQRESRSPAQSHGYVDAASSAPIPRRRACSCTPSRCLKLLCSVNPRCHLVSCSAPLPHRGDAVSRAVSRVAKLSLSYLKYGFTCILHRPD